MDVDIENKGVDKIYWNLYQAQGIFTSLKCLPHFEIIIKRTFRNVPVNHVHSLTIKYLIKNIIVLSCRPQAVSFYYRVMGLRIFGRGIDIFDNK